MRAAMLMLALIAMLAACRDRSAVGTMPWGDPDRGRILIHLDGCGGCHSIPGVSGARGTVGPPLRGIADRVYVAGVVPNRQADLVRWLRDPGAVDPHTAMPDLGLSERDARDVAAYLRTLHADPLSLRMVRGFIEKIGGTHAAPAGAEAD